VTTMRYTNRRILYFTMPNNIAFIVKHIKVALLNFYGLDHVIRRTKVARFAISRYVYFQQFEKKT